MSQPPNERELLEATLSISPDERSDFLLHQCGDNPELRERVQRLLAAHARAEAFSGDQLGPEHFIAQATGRSTEHYPEEIGGYRIRRLLGRGGMGVVFEAEQASPRRVVALKVLNGEFLTEDMRRRFALEAEALGRLQHASIAQVYEAGVFDDEGVKQPYIAMELIHGTPISRYADEHKLDTAQRLSLLSKVCEGVQHAHQRGIIHRDLKPDNILVDDEGQPKILDFGLARVTDSDVHTSSQNTNIGQIMGTISYMSPEQALGDPDEIDIRSDIYSMGVVAYELVSGEMPYSTKTLVMLEALRVVREVQPRPLGSVSRNLRGDVNTIVGKALEKEPDRRYASAAAMADDIRRYLSEKPIHAHPPSAIYQVRKFTRRHRGLVAGFTVVLLALAIGLIGMLRGYAAAARAGERALSAVDFFQTVLTGVDPVVAQGQDTALLHSILDDAAARIESELGSEPRVAAAMHETMASAYASISEHESALQQSQLARQLFSQVLGASSEEALDMHIRQCVALGKLGRRSEAEEEYEDCIAEIHRAFGPLHPLADKARISLGVLLLDDQNYVEAAKRLEPSLAYHRAKSEAGGHAGADPESLMVALNSMGVLRLGQRRFPEAEELLDEGLAYRERVSGALHPDTIQSLFNRGALYSAQQRFEDAQVVLRDAIIRAEKVLGPRHEITLVGMRSLANSLIDSGALSDALSLRKSCFETRLALHGPDDYRTLKAEEGLAISYRLSKRFELAEEHAQHASDGLETWFGPDHPRALTAKLTLGIILTRGGKLEEADALMTDLLDASLRVYGKDHSDVLQLQSSLADLCKKGGQAARAEEYFRDALEGRQRNLGPGHTSTLVTLGRFARFLDDSGRDDEAIPLYGEFLVRWREKSGVEHKNLVHVSAKLLRHFARVDRLGPHEVHVRRVLDYHEQLTPKSADVIATDLVFLAQALAENDDLTGASRALARVDALLPEAEPPLPARAAWAAETSGLRAGADAALEAVWEQEIDPPSTERAFAARKLAESAEADSRTEAAALWRERAASVAGSSDPSESR